MIGCLWGNRALCDDSTRVWGQDTNVMRGYLCGDSALCDDMTLVGKQDTM